VRDSGGLPASQRGATARGVGGLRCRRCPPVPSPRRQGAGPGRLVRAGRAHPDRGGRAERAVALPAVRSPRPRPRRGPAAPREPPRRPPDAARHLQRVGPGGIRCRRRGGEPRSGRGVTRAGFGVEGRRVPAPGG